MRRYRHVLVVHLQDSLAVAEAIVVGLLEYVERGVLSLRGQAYRG